jgi:hypothetical protein
MPFPMTWGSGCSSVPGHWYSRAKQSRGVVPGRHYSLPHHLINAARAVHDLLHLHFGLQIIRRFIELAPQTVCRAIQIVHGILKVVFWLPSFFLPRILVRGVCTLPRFALRCSSPIRPDPWRFRRGWSDTSRNHPRRFPLCGCGQPPEPC